MEIDSQAIGTVARIVTLKTVMGKTEGMIGMQHQKGVVAGTGMEAETGMEHNVTREGATRTGQVLMIALTGEAAPLRSIAINHSMTDWVLPP